MIALTGELHNIKPTPFSLHINVLLMFVLGVLTTNRNAVVCVIRVSNVKRHLALLVTVELIRISNIKRHPALLVGGRGLNGAVLIDGCVSRRGGLLCSLFQDWTVGLSQLPLLHQGALRGAGRLDISWVRELEHCLDKVQTYTVQQRNLSTKHVFLLKFTQ